MKHLKPILLKNSCLQCGRYCNFYKYCDFCIKPLIIEDIAFCNYCKNNCPVLIDGHCTSCHNKLLKNRSNFLIQVNKHYIAEIIKQIGFQNYRYLFEYFEEINK